MMSTPPPNYIAGLGRGASGFTTRSDIGPVSGPIGRGDEDDDVNNGNDDVWLLASYEEDDAEADEIWEAIDERMASRRKEKREARLKSQIQNYRDSNPTITEQFADLKRNLNSISAEDWDGIPEISDYSKRNNKRRRFESFVPVPDTLLAKAIIEKEQSVDINLINLNLTDVGEGRGKVLSLKLDRLSDSVSGFSVVDPLGYMTDLRSMKVLSGGEKKERLMMRSVTQSDPKNGLGWIGAAEVEERAGRIREARKLIMRGCEECPKREDVWLAACRLASPEKAKLVIERGLRAIPDSVSLWLRAAELENDVAVKSRVIRQGLERVQISVKLWEKVVELASEEGDKRLLLNRAVECCPLEVKFWVDLAKIESYGNAKKVLNKAKGRLPKEPRIWVEAAKLEEKNNGGIDKVGKIVERGIRALQEQGVEIDREEWMKEAEKAEHAGSVLTCKAIVRCTVGIGVEEEDRKRTWVADAEECEKRGSIETARAIYEYALTVFLTKRSLWLKAAMLEKNHGSRESVDTVLRRAVTYMPRTEVLWLMGAKEKWLAGDVPAARTILQEAFAAIPNSEGIWLAAFKLEFENQEPERARMLLTKARERGGTGRVWMKSAIVERELGNTDEEKKLLDEGIKRFPLFFKLRLMRGQLEERLGNLDQAKAIYEKGRDLCPQCIPLWLSLAMLEEKRCGLSRSRAVLTMARKNNPKNSELWVAAIRAELRHGYKKEADVMMAKALQECPRSGVLWALAIVISPAHQQKSKSADAQIRCGNDPHVFVASAEVCWQERRFDAARKYFKEAVTLAPDIGDFWALYYKFELQHGTDVTQRDVLNRCISAEPKHGEKWQSISKAVENSHQPTESILKKVVLLLEKEKSDAESSKT